jgi:hypothetical protein
MPVRNWSSNCDFCRWAGITHSVADLVPHPYSLLAIFVTAYVDYPEVPATRDLFFFFSFGSLLVFSNESAFDPLCL